MKKVIAVLLLAVGAFICAANEYTSLQEEQKDIERKISSLEEKKRSNLRWLTDSIRANLHLDKDLAELKRHLEDVKNKISSIETNTSVYITRITLQNIPEFDVEGGLDLRIYFRNQGPSNSFCVLDYCGKQADFSLPGIKIDVSDAICIADEDGVVFKKWEDMGQISCRDIFFEALRNDSASGCFSRSIQTIVNSESYQIFIYYSRQ